MKLGQAFVLRDHLEGVLDALQARILREKEMGLPTEQSVSEYLSKLTEHKDIDLAISYTEHVSYVSGAPLVFFTQRQKAHQNILDLLTRTDIVIYKTRIADLLEAIKADEELIQLASWSLDLQVPKLGAPAQ